MRVGEGPESLGSRHPDAGLIPREGREREREGVTEASELSHAVQQGPQGVREPKSSGQGFACLLGMGLLGIPSASATGGSSRSERRTVMATTVSTTLLVTTASFIFRNLFLSCSRSTCPGLSQLERHGPWLHL